MRRIAVEICSNHDCNIHFALQVPKEIKTNQWGKKERERKQKIYRKYKIDSNIIYFRFFHSFIWKLVLVIHQLLFSLCHTPAAHSPYITFANNMILLASARVTYARSSLMLAAAKMIYDLICIIQYSRITWLVNFSHREFISYPLNNFGLFHFNIHCIYA